MTLVEKPLGAQALLEFFKGHLQSADPLGLQILDNQLVSAPGCINANASQPL